MGNQQQVHLVKNHLVIKSLSLKTCNICTSRKKQRANFPNNQRALINQLKIDQKLKEKGEGTEIIHKERICK